jgi:hypothetical protein
MTLQKDGKNHNAGVASHSQSDKTGVKRPRQILGYTVLAVGVAGIFVGASPIFPVFLEAFVVGGLLIVAGVWILAGPDLRALVRKAAGIALSSRRGARRRPATRVVIDPLLPVRILKLAREHQGTLTVADVAISLNVPLDQAEAGLLDCVDAGNAISDYDIARAHAFYRFPEFSPE